MASHSRYSRAKKYQPKEKPGAGKLNQLVDMSNALKDIRGSECIKVTSVNGVFTVAIDWKMLYTKLPTLQASEYVTFTSSAMVEEDNPEDAHPGEFTAYNQCDGSGNPIHRQWLLLKADRVCDLVEATSEFWFPFYCKYYGGAPNACQRYWWEFYAITEQFHCGASTDLEVIGDGEIEDDSVNGVYPANGTYGGYTHYERGDGVYEARYEAPIGYIITVTGGDEAVDPFFRKCGSITSVTGTYYGNNGATGNPIADGGDTVTWNAKPTMDWLADGIFSHDGVKMSVNFEAGMDRHNACSVNDGGGWWNANGVYGVCLRSHLWHLGNAGGNSTHTVDITKLLMKP